MQAQELEDLKRLVIAEAGVCPTVGPDMDQLSPIVPSTPTVLVESADKLSDVRDREDRMLEQLVSEEGFGIADVVDSASPIAEVGKGKSAASIMYTSRKRARGWTFATNMSHHLLCKATMEVWLLARWTPQQLSMSNPTALPDMSDDMALLHRRPVHCLPS